jgi:hypothetical protein
MMVLQNYTNLRKLVPGSCSETNLTSCDGNHAISIKVEDVTDTQEEQEDPLLTEFPLIKVEHEVSCLSVCTILNTCQKCIVLSIICLITICFNMKRLHSGELILKSSFQNVSRVFHHTFFVECHFHFAFHQFSGIK